MRRGLIVVATTMCLASSGCLTLFNSNAKRDIEIDRGMGLVAVTMDGLIALGPTAVVGSNLQAWMLWWAGILVVDFVVMVIRAYRS